MNDSKIPVRYAKSLFLAAVEANKLDRIIADFNLIGSSFEMKDFRGFLDSPVIKTSEKAEVVKKAFSKNLDKLSMDFLILVLKNKRESYLPSIIRNFTGFSREHKGIKNAELIVPAKVSDVQKKKFVDLLTKVYKSRIEFVDRINPDLIGGFILKVEDEQFDASVSTYLSKIKKELIETSLEK